MVNVTSETVTLTIDGQQVSVPKGTNVLEAAKLLGIDPFEMRRINKVRETDRIESIWKEPSDAFFGSYGIDQCLDLVEKALASGRGLPKPEGEDWLEGTGIGLAIVRRAVERCGGKVGVESDGQSGSRFWVELPAA